MMEAHIKVTALVEDAMNTTRRADAGRPEGLEELARSEVRRYLDRASLGWNARQALIQVAEVEIARRRMG